MFYLDPRAKFTGYTDGGMAVYKVPEKETAAKHNAENVNRKNNRLK